MKVFIRPTELTSGHAPTVIASYADDTDVPLDAHGDAVVLTVPNKLLVFETFPDGTPKPPKLKEGWREQAAEATLAAEAQRRIDEVMTPSEQISGIYELLQFTMQYGGDVSQWPQDAKARKAELETAFNYAREVRERARAQRGVPVNPMSDKAWPTRIARKK
jgi:hypothetical protein